MGVKKLVVIFLLQCYSLAFSMELTKDEIENLTPETFIDFMYEVSFVEFEKLYGEVKIRNYKLLPQLACYHHYLTCFDECYFTNLLETFAFLIYDRREKMALFRIIKNFKGYYYKPIKKKDLKF